MMRKESEDKHNVEMFFRSIFLTIDDGKDNNNFQDKAEPYNINILNAYLKGVMQKHLSPIEYEVLRMAYGLDCNKHKGLEIANALGIKGINNFVRVSEIKKKAVDKLIDSVDYNQFIDIF